MSDQRFTLDSNVLIYYLDVSGAERHATARRIVERSFGADCVLTLQSLAEFYRVTTQKLKVDGQTAKQQVDAWMTSFTVVAADQAALRDAIDAEHSHGLSFWDAMLWATARAAGCRLIVTEDYQSGRAVQSVRFINPFVSPDLPAELERVLARP